MPDQARIAIIGTGWWSSTAHFPALAAHPAAQITAICDTREEVLAMMAAKFGVDKTYTDCRDLLANEKLDGAVVAVWHAAHYDVTRACLEHDLHVMLEKPMALTAKHARALVDLAAARSRELIIGYPMHFSPRVLEARDLIQSGELGKVLYINCYFASSTIHMLRGDDSVYGNEHNYPVIGPGDVYGDPVRSGGGQGHLQVTHSASVMHFITGLRPVRVLALMNNLDARADVVDAITAQMDNGALANIGSTGNLQVSDGGLLPLHIACERGRLDIECVAGVMHVRHPDGTDEQFEPLLVEDTPDGADQPEESYPLRATATNLVDVIIGAQPNGSPAECGWHTVELLDAAYRSAAQNGQAVNVESLYD